MKKLLIFFLLLTSSKLTISKDYLTCEGSWAWVINSRHIGDYEDKLVITRDKTDEYDHIYIQTSSFRNEKYKEKDLKDGINLEPYFIETETEIIVPKYKYGYRSADADTYYTRDIKLNRISGKFSMENMSILPKGSIERTFTGFCKKTDKLL